ncbi:MAG: glycosyltransferase [Sphingopyxis solisilvae]|uniref:glycosyltransferase n=1 Tax=Sphingopyxis solisilvae TaxID=1886788 RepID=UPI004036F958
MAEAIEAFDGMNIAVFVQNPFSLMTSCHRALERGFNPKTHVRFWFGIADVCRSHLSVLGLEPSAIFPVTMKPQEFPFQTCKEKLITYMPRKRPWEAALIADALGRRNKLLGYRIEALENMPRAEVARKLSSTRIFISLLKHEALGFPAAEAMAAGCIVVGFDGLGTAEYFDKDVGVPVTEGDVAALVTAVEQTVNEYEADPTRLDIMRLKASQRVNNRYSVSAFQIGVLDAWNQFNDTLDDQGL